MKNNMGISAVLPVLAISSLICSCSFLRQEEKSLTSYVDPLIGSGGHGHVFVGANVPFGMVQLGPTSIPQEWDWTSGYHVSDSTVIGFSHTHLSGTGIGDLFDVTVMPVTGAVEYARGGEDVPGSGLWSYADRSREKAVPGYYSVPLTRYGITAELTATARVGMHRYTFPANDSAAIVFDLENGGCWDRTVDCGFDIHGDRAVSGYRFSSGWADDQRVYFYAEFSKPFSSYEISGNGMYARFSFKTEENERILMKVALSPVSEDKAEANMAAELSGWDFDSVAVAADDAWNRELSKIRISTDNESRKRIFYTALYHTMIAPSLFCDADGGYRGTDKLVHGDEGFVNYTTFSLWDTYRAAHPLMTIIHPEKVPDMINTMLAIYRQQGKLPVWHLMGCETNCMVGNPGIPVVADAVLKGFGGFDRKSAYEALVNSAMVADRGQQYRMKYGYIPCDKMNESVAYDMEYAIADWAVAQVAEAMGNGQDYGYFMERSRSYRNYFDSSTGFIRGKDSKGRFRAPFDPYSSSHRNDDYCEGNAWQYTWLVPHDLDGLAGCFGSKEALACKLDSLFMVDSKITGKDSSPDISGFVGQYAHGNEPSHHILYFHTMLGQPWKTADKVRYVLDSLYHDAPDGLSGNEDVGQMSAWYILSSLGFYQVEPAGGRYYFGSPFFDEAEIKVKGGIFRVVAHGNSDEARYIERVRLNGDIYTKPYLDFKDIEAGGLLEFEMSATPSLWYCPEEPDEYVSRRPDPQARLFVSPAIEDEIRRISGMLDNPRLAWMFSNCFPNTLDTTVHYDEDGDGVPDTFVYTGDIPAMWLRDSGAQVWPYLPYINEDEGLRKMIAGVILRQFSLINTDPYANAFNQGPTGAGNPADVFGRKPEVFERKWEIDSHCYPVRLAYEYWKTSGDTSVFGEEWLSAVKNILAVFREQQRKDGHGSYAFLRVTDRQLDTKCVVGRGNPVRPVGLIASAFRPSDDATTFEFLVPSNFMAVSSLRKAAEILRDVNGEEALAGECGALADEVETALYEYAVADHPVFGKIFAFEVDGFGNKYLMDDANVPSLLSMAYLGDVERDNPVYENTRRFVLSEYNPYFFRGCCGEGIGGPHIGAEVIWPMSIMMRAFTSDDDDEIADCIRTLMITDAGTGFIHESFHKDDASLYTRDWFAWQNGLFGELIIKLVNDGKIDLLNSIR